MIERLFAASDGKIPIGGGGLHNVTKTSADHLLTGVLNTVYLWAGIICVIIIVIAGFYYTTSSGNSQQTERAKNAIIASIVGLVVITMAFSITNFVIGKV